MALIKVNADSVSRSKVLEIANIFRVNIVDIGVESLTMEISGGKQKINSLIELETVWHQGNSKNRKDSYFKGNTNSGRRGWNFSIRTR